MLSLHPRAVDDLLELILGEVVGEGCHRKAYLYLPDTSFVVKVEKQPYKFDNIQEWDVWEASEGSELRKWLAKPLTISASGQILIQERTRPIAESDLPLLVPDVLADTKADNWGWAERDGERLAVCHDYAHNSVMKRGLRGKKVRLVKASWHSPEYAGWSKK